MVVLGGVADSYERGTPVRNEHATGSHLAVNINKCAKTYAVFLDYSETHTSKTPCFLCEPFLMSEVPLYTRSSQ